MSPRRCYHLPPFQKLISLWRTILYTSSIWRSLKRWRAHRSTINFIIHGTFANFSMGTHLTYFTQNIKYRIIPWGTRLVCDRVWQRRKETHLINWLTPGGAPVPPWEGHSAYLAPSPVWELLHHPYIITIHLHDSQASLSAQGRRRTGRWPCADNGHSVSSQLTI